MKTTKPIATISYNSLPFLYGVLDRLTKSDILSFWVFIEHQPEEDETKSHCHVYMEPAKPLETTWLRKQFIEVDPSHPNEPLGVLPINKSKFVDWYWYGLHDKAYLASKGQSRKYDYPKSAMVTSDIEYLMEMERNNPNPKAVILQVAEDLMLGMAPLEIAVRQNVPLRNLSYFLEGVHIIKGNIAQITHRGESKPHEEKIYQEEDEQ